MQGNPAAISLQQPLTLSTVFNADNHIIDEDEMSHEALHRIRYRVAMKLEEKTVEDRRAPRELRKKSFFQGQPVTFSEEAFLAQKPGAPLQAFHKKAVHLQLFKQVSHWGGA